MTRREWLAKHGFWGAPQSHVGVPEVRSHSGGRRCHHRRFWARTRASCRSRAARARALSLAPDFLRSRSARRSRQWAPSVGRIHAAAAVRMYGWSRTSWSGLIPKGSLIERLIGPLTAHSRSRESRSTYVFLCQPFRAGTGGVSARPNVEVRDSCGVPLVSVERTQMPLAVKVPTARQRRVFRDCARNSRRVSIEFSTFRRLP